MTAPVKIQFIFTQWTDINNKKKALINNIFFLLWCPDAFTKFKHFFINQLVITVKMTEKQYEIFGFPTINSTNTCLVLRVGYPAAILLIIQDVFINTGNYYTCEKTNLFMNEETIRRHISSETLEIVTRIRAAGTIQWCKGSNMFPLCNIAHVGHSIEENWDLPIPHRFFFLEFSILQKISHYILHKDKDYETFI